MSMSSFVRATRFFSHDDIIVANNERRLTQGAITSRRSWYFQDGTEIYETRCALYRR